MAYNCSSMFLVFSAVLQRVTHSSSAELTNAVVARSVDSYPPSPRFTANTHPPPRSEFSTVKIFWIKRGLLIKSLTLNS